MFKNKAKNALMVIALFFTFIFLMTVSFAKTLNNERENNNIENDEWKISITGQGKDLTVKDTQNIIFKTQDNPNVVSGKIAPGSTAIATIQVDMSGTKVPVELKTIVDDQILNNTNLKLTIEIDGKEYSSGETKIIELENGKAFDETNGKKIITLKLTWENDDDNQIDTAMGILGSKISIPVTINVEQHI